jgi:excisionase family DNA binding protein
MSNGNAGDLFLEAVAERVFEKLLPVIIERMDAQREELKNERFGVKQAAEYLGVSPETLYRLCKEKKIRHIIVGTTNSKKPRILFTRFSLDKWIKDQEDKSIMPLED